MSFIFRVMTSDGSKPAIGQTRRTLGVRTSPAELPDIPVDAQGNVAPGTGGMSVTPDWKSLFFYQIPKTLRHLVPKATGSSVDKVWRLTDAPFIEGVVAERLQLRIDTPKHGKIEPTEAVPLAAFQADLAATRDQWVMVEG